MADERHYLTQFNTLGLAEPLLHAISSEGYKAPTPIQAQVIPAMMKGQDILGIAQTGTGKTASFVLPILHRISKQNKRPAPRTCTALILTPTRELANQIADNIKIYGSKLRPSVAIVVGGVRPGPQVKALANGIDIVVATPGRLLDLMQERAVSLDATKVVVLDEADQMLDLGFVPAIKRIMKQSPSSRQTVLMSATMPTQIRNLAKTFQTGPAEISVAPVSRPIEKISQSVIDVIKGNKVEILLHLVSGPEVKRAIIFTRTKRGADKVNMKLQKAGHFSAAIHGNKSQGQRERALKAFSTGKSPILVATDIAARGIDIDDVSHVINYDLPNIVESYVHRIGRTARAGRKGVAISLCDPSEKSYMRDIEKLIGNKIERQQVDLSARPQSSEKNKPSERRQSSERRQPSAKNRSASKNRPASKKWSPSEDLSAPEEMPTRSRTGTDEKPNQKRKPTHRKRNNNSARPGASTRSESSNRSGTPNRRGTSTSKGRPDRTKTTGRPASAGNNKNKKRPAQKRRQRASA